jgi:sulfur-carrier protein
MAGAVTGSAGSGTTASDHAASGRAARGAEGSAVACSAGAGSAGVGGAGVGGAVSDSVVSDSAVSGSAVSDSAVSDSRSGGVIRYWAAAKAAAGTAEEPYRERTLADALAAARKRHGDRPEFARVLSNCSFLVNGDPVGTRDHSGVALADDGTVEVLPPFAGG